MPQFDTSRYPAYPWLGQGVPLDSEDELRAALRTDQFRAHWQPVVTCSSGELLGFEALKAGHGDSLAYRRPAALLAQGRALAPQVSAMMDVSDGLLIDAQRLAIASEVTIALDRASVPVATGEAQRDDALRWGDDYQLLFTLPATMAPAVAAHRIGAVHAQGPSPLLLDGTPPTAPLGYEHR